MQLTQRQRELIDGMSSTEQAEFLALSDEDKLERLVSLEKGDDTEDSKETE